MQRGAHRERPAGTGAAAALRRCRGLSLPAGRAVSSLAHRPACGCACRAQLNEEQLRASKLRGELASLSGSHIKDQKEKSGLLADTLARLQVGGAACRQSAC